MKRLPPQQDSMCPHRRPALSLPEGDRPTIDAARHFLRSPHRLCYRFCQVQRARQNSCRILGRQAICASPRIGGGHGLFNGRFFWFVSSCPVGRRISAELSTTAASPSNLLRILSSATSKTNYEDELHAQTHPVTRRFDEFSNHRSMTIIGACR